MRIIELTVICLLALLPSDAYYQWGVIGVLNGKPHMYSVSKLSNGCNYHAYNINSFNEQFNLCVSQNMRKLDSPLLNSVGEAARWEQTFFSESKLPNGTIWIVTPAIWELRKSESHTADIIISGKLRGSVNIVKQSEGIEITVRFNSKREKNYYYLGYDIQ